MSTVCGSIIHIRTAHKKMNSNSAIEVYINYVIME